MEICYIKFLDTSLTEQVWQTKRKAIKNSGLAMCEAVGFLLSQDAEKIKITISHGRGNVLDVLTIPVSCIIDIKFVPNKVLEALE
jgi:hypothetical protein